MQVVLIGSGNTATVLGKLIIRAGHHILQVWARNELSGKALAEALNAAWIKLPSEITASADLFIIAVADNAIETVAQELPLRNQLVVHTAGSVSKEVLAHASKNYGVLYPLQSLRKEVSAIPEIPFLVDGNTNDDRTLIMDFATTLSKHVLFANDSQRRHYHLAATITNNFSNHLFTLAKQYCDNTGTDFSILLPLIQQLPQRLAETSPQSLQTGPAMRNDTQTIQKHLELLQAMPELREIYEVFTKSIRGFYHRKE
jgi:predicted short-subunit dehydrogenase-like oxidoreductase (DUF2520 family)